MDTSKIILKAEGSERVGAKTPQDRKVLFVLCFSILAMITLGAFYTQQQPVTSGALMTQVEIQQSPLNQACRDKLVSYIQQGGVDLKSKMQYGDLQGCNFSSASEITRQRRAIEKQQRSWSAQVSAE